MNDIGIISRTIFYTQIPNEERDGCVRACSPRVNQDATSSFKASYFLSLQRAISTQARNRANTRLNINFANCTRYFEIFHASFS